ncbi:unnamed protein product, partial [Choristocarpus tenellus]
MALSTELQGFLRTQATSSLDPATTLALLAAHGRTAESLLYAELVEDYDRVLAHHVHAGHDYTAALEVLRKAPFDKVEPLVYKYSATLMAADPRGTTETWCAPPPPPPPPL